jgi:PKD repeat protein
LLFVIFLVSGNIYAQVRISASEITRINDFLAIAEVEITAGDSLLIQFEREFSSLAIKAPEIFFEEYNLPPFLMISQQSFQILQDIHVEVNSGDFSSNLILPTQNFSSAIIFHPTFSGRIKVHLIYAAVREVQNLEKYRVLEDPCAPPIAVPQSEWRAGLPDPDYTRSFTQVQHMIIHHSAGSNTETDYVKVVRNIYLFHTQSNGWSDMGYNYLVAQDGTIFTGRDPLAGEQDNVIGAHFCGRNAGTMGICILGTYSNVEPTTVALQSVASVLTWKAFKDNLDPLGFQSHPANPNLGVIAGHRNGCATECPGQRTYNKLDSIRGAVQHLLFTCDSDRVIARASFLPIISLVDQPIVFRDQSFGRIVDREWYFPGAQTVIIAENEQSAEVRYFSSGTYSYGLRVANELEEDSIYYDGAISVYSHVKADFLADKTEVFVGESIRFIDRSEGDPVKWEWRFFDGLPETSVEQNPGSVVYQRPGNYAVELSVSNPVSNDSKRVLNFITVTERPDLIIRVNKNPIERGENLQMQVDQRQVVRYTYLVNMQGQAFAVRNSFSATNVLELETKHLAPGLYILFAESNKELFQSRIVIR